MGVLSLTPFGLQYLQSRATHTYSLIVTSLKNRAAHAFNPVLATFKTKRRRMLRGLVHTILVHTMLVHTMLVHTMYACTYYTCTMPSSPRLPSPQLSPAMWRAGQPFANLSPLSAVALPSLPPSFSPPRPHPLIRPPLLPQPIPPLFSLLLVPWIGK